MAAPNLLSLTTVTAKSLQVLLTTTVTTDILTNSAASGKVFMVKSINVANVDGTNSSNLTLGIIKSGGSVIKLAHVIPVPAGSAINFDGVCPIFLEEGDLIEGGASSASDLDFTVNYIELS